MNAQAFSPFVPEPSSSGMRGSRRHPHKGPELPLTLHSLPEHRSTPRNGRPAIWRVRGSPGRGLVGRLPGLGRAGLWWLISQLETAISQVATTSGNCGGRITRTDPVHALLGLLAPRDNSVAFQENFNVARRPDMPEPMRPQAARSCWGPEPGRRPVGFSHISGTPIHRCFIKVNQSLIAFPRPARS